MPAARKHAVKVTGDAGAVKEAVEKASKLRKRHYVNVDSLSARPHPLPRGAVVPDDTFSDETLAQLLEAGILTHERPGDEN